MRTYQRLVLHGGRVFRLVLPDQLDARCRRAELRGGSRDYKRGTCKLANCISHILSTFVPLATGTKERLNRPSRGLDV